MTIGTTGTAKTIVSKNNTAKSVKSGSLEVYSTPMMIALMEEAACNSLQLEEGQTSVGTYIAVEHKVASGLDNEVIAVATVTEVEGRKITFTVTAKSSDMEIGEGTHIRYIVDAERFMSKVK